MEIYFSRPDEDNVSDDLNEALMVSVIRNLRAPWPPPRITPPAPPNLMWAATMAENRVVKLGKQGGLPVPQHGAPAGGAYTDCKNHGQGLAVLHPVYYRHIYQDGLPKFPPVCPEGLGTAPDGRSDGALALAGDRGFGPASSATWACPPPSASWGWSGAAKEIADSCGISPGSYRRMTHQEILELFQECYESPVTLLKGDFPMKSSLPSC